MSVLYQDKDLREKWLRSYIDDMRNKQDLKQMDVIYFYSYLNYNNNISI
jgi:hypothetical protein